MAGAAPALSAPLVVGFHFPFATRHGRAGTDDRPDALSGVLGHLPDRSSGTAPDRWQGRKLYKRVKIKTGADVPGACIFGPVRYSTDQSSFFATLRGPCWGEAGVRGERKPAAHGGADRPERVE